MQIVKMDKITSSNVPHVLSIDRGYASCVVVFNWGYPALLESPTITVIPTLILGVGTSFTCDVYAGGDAEVCRATLLRVVDDALKLSQLVFDNYTVAA